MPKWSTATLLKNERIAPALHRLWLTVEDDVAAAFHVPGQYHRVRLPQGSESVFAMASAPGSTEFEYLVRGVGETADQFIALGVGAQVQVSLPEGPGFPLDRAVGRPLLLIGTGTGFAPLRSVLLTARKDLSRFGPVHVLYGAHDVDQLAYRDELEAWPAEGISVRSTLTRPEAGWTGAVGRVQQHLAHLPVERALAFLCGQAQMVSDVTQALISRGMARNDVFLNLPGQTV